MVFSPVTTQNPPEYCGTKCRSLLKLVRAVVVVLIADMIVCDSGYAVPLEMARIWAEQALDAPLRWCRADLA